MAGLTQGSAGAEEGALLDEELFVIRIRAQRAGARAVRMQAFLALVPVLLLAAAAAVCSVLIWLDPT